MRAQAAQRNAVEKCSLLQPLNLAVLLAFHLDMQNLYGVESQPGGFVDASLNG